MNLFKKIKEIFISNELPKIDFNIGKFNNVDVAYKEFELNNSKILIPALIYKGNNKFVILDSYTPRNRSYLGLQAEILYDIKDFFYEISFMIDHLYNKPITINSLALAFQELIKFHIKKHNRIIDTDLYSYISLVMLLRSKILKIEGEQKTIQNKYWQYFYDHFMLEFSEYYFITKYDSSNKPYLEKLR